MGRGTHRGFITFEELNKSLGKRNLSDENLEQAFMHILDEGVALVEKKSDFQRNKRAKKTKKHQLNPSKNTWIFLKLGLYKSSQIYYCGKNNYKIIC